jgi:NAD-dependent DNA ligase
LLYLIKEIIKFKGIGDKAATALVESGAVNGLADLFKPIKAPEGVSQDLIDNLVATMRTISLTGLISILGIPGLGATTARKMLYEVKTLPNFVHILNNPHQVMMLDIPEYVKMSIVKWYANPESQQLLRDLIALGMPNWL